MKIEYLTDITTLDELKAKYRELCRRFHPDLGGNTHVMQQINSEYEYLLNTHDFEYGKSSIEIEGQLREVIESTVILEGLIVEICGRWLWFTGQTKKHKDTLKALGCRWARKKCAWYWRSADEKRTKGHKPLPLDKIRQKYGSTILEKKSLKALAA